MYLISGVIGLHGSLYMRFEAFDGWEGHVMDNAGVVSHLLTIHEYVIWSEFEMIVIK